MPPEATDPSAACHRTIAFATPATQLAFTGVGVHRSGRDHADRRPSRQLN
jgi:hypothetical protein